MAASFCSVIMLGSGFGKLSKDLLNQQDTASLSPSPYAGILPCSWPSIQTVFNRTLARWSEVQRQQRCQGTSSRSMAEHSINNFDEKKEDVSRATLIWRAIKLPMYSVALVPLTVGSAAAYLQNSLYSAKRYFILLASSVLIIAWLNLSNDVYDFDTGADKTKKESVINIAGSRTGVLLAACMLLVLGFMGLAWVSAETGSMRSILLLSGAIICGYIYQCPPFRLSYQGLGEPLCFAAFGPFATTAFYLLQSSTSELPITGTILSASFLVGITTSLILFCSHFHQVKGDIAVGKISPLVRFGTKTGSEIVKVAVMTLYLLLLISSLSRALPFTCILLCSLTLPMGKLVVNYVEENHKDNAKIFMAKYYCVRLHTLFGAALAAGLVAAKLVHGRSIL
ncbi:2-carboxy-1,4-naphthoquinone phytyltransferase, chloroplastic isoform X2 [Diospyros lotus]|uniref:2-carboxy-1,4-naphthoquinone phytyltransferase, chloroplastic isoform X2 n=1 Tax=Diospyros lotus TaxID=55363 RepID=UPI0022521211|nr:2-carboxy-1,4-naphthoquinone phytyltransferase, chloroplastic isoform X2 [Diospyros lotus]